jgi:hypothetical protein
LDAVSMVRAAFDGDGRNFHHPRHRLVFAAWLKTPTAALEIAINRLPTKLRFPQGSEVSIIGCLKFVTAAGARLINPVLKAGTVLPELRPWRSVFVFPRS